MSEGIEALIAAGEWQEAASLCEGQGLMKRAEELYARLMDDASAGRVAEQDGRPIAALRHYLHGDHREAAERVRRHLMATLSERVPEAIALFRERRLHFQAAEMAESVGQLEEAARLYREAHEFLEAASIFERIGRFREAGELYESVIVANPESATAQLGMGRILQRFERHLDAARALTRAAQLGSASETQLEARHRLAYSLLQMGLNEAARAVLARPLPGAVSDAPESPSPGAFRRFFEDHYGAPGGGFSERYSVRGTMAGPYAEAYEALDTMAERAVLIQPLHGSGEARGEYVGSLRRLTEPTPPGILRLVNVDEALRYVVFEAPGGEPLSEILSRGRRYSGSQMRSLALQLVSAVEAAHKRGVLHGALSPWSVFVRAGVGIVLAGFELSLLGSRQETQTSGGYDNPLSYLPPEVAFGGVGDLRSDFFGVGAVLYRMVTGEPPPLGQPATAPTGWERLFDGLLAEEPGSRPGSHAKVRALIEGQDWSLAGEAKEVRASEAGAASISGARYEVREVLGAVERVHDTWLRRDVQRFRYGRAPEMEERERIRVFAQPGFSVLQRILSADIEAGEIILEPLSGDLSGAASMDWRGRLGIVHRLWETLGELHERGVPLGGFAVEDVLLEEGRTELPRLRIEGRLGRAGEAGYAKDRASLDALAERIFDVRGGLAGVLRQLASEQRGGLGHGDALERRLAELERAGESVLEAGACLREVVEHAALVARRSQVYHTLRERGVKPQVLEALAKRWDVRL